MEIHSLLHPWRVKRLKRYITHLSGLVAYYPLWENDGAVAYNHAPDNLRTINGAIAGTTVGQEGLIGKAYSFDGTGDSVALTGLSLSATAFTVGLLFYINGTPDANDRIFDTADGGPANGLEISLATTPSVTAIIRNNTTTVFSQNTGTLVDATWYFLAVTYEVNSAKLFLNGAQVGTTDTSVTMAAHSATPTIGKRATSASGFLTGSVQHLFTADAVLSENQILKLAQIAGVA